MNTHPETFTQLVCSVIGDVLLKGMSAIPYSGILFSGHDVPMTDINGTNRSFQHAALHLWNKLPHSFREPHPHPGLSPAHYQWRREARARRVK